MTKKTLKERNKEYGSFTDNAGMTCLLKALMEDSNEWDNLLDTQKEALHMIAQKISRILNGNPHNMDSWHDIAGYATLVENELRWYEEDNALKRIEDDAEKQVKKLKEEAFIKFLDKNIYSFFINAERKSHKLDYVPLAYIEDIGFIDIGDEYEERLQLMANKSDIVYYFVNSSDYIAGTKALSITALHPESRHEEEISKHCAWGDNNLFMRCGCGKVIIAESDYIGYNYHCDNYNLTPINFVE